MASSGRFLFFSSMISSSRSHSFKFLSLDRRRDQGGGEGKGREGRGREGMGRWLTFEREIVPFDRLLHISVAIYMEGESAVLSLPSIFAVLWSRPLIDSSYSL
jgi:hypothetical protein